MIHQKWQDYKQIFLSHPRMASYDGLRFFSILLIVIYHTLAESVKFNVISPDLFVLLRDMFVMSLLSLFSGSGFFIFLLLLKQIEKKGQIQLFHYWMGRILRTWPLYFFMLLIYWLVDPRLTFNDLIYFFTFTQNFVVYKYNFFNPSWTLAIEEQFYFFAPLALIFFKRIRIEFKILFLVVLFCIIRYNLRLGLNNEYHTVYWVDGFTCGLLAAYTYHQKKFLHNFLISNPNLTSLLGVIIYYATQYLPKFLHFVSPFTAFLGTSIMIYPLLSEKHFLNAFLSRRVFNYLAAISYAMYLTHDLIIQFVFSSLADKFFVMPYGLGLLVMILFCVLCTLVASSLLFFIIEIPIYKFREKHFKK